MKENKENKENKIESLEKLLLYKDFIKKVENTSADNFEDLKYILELQKMFPSINGEKVVLKFLNSNLDS